MTQDASKDPPRSTHQEILEEEQVRVNHVVDVLHKYRRIIDIMQAGINK